MLRISRITSKRRKKTHARICGRDTDRERRKERERERELIEKVSSICVLERKSYGFEWIVGPAKERKGDG